MNLRFRHGWRVAEDEDARLIRREVDRETLGGRRGNGGVVGIPELRSLVSRCERRSSVDGLVSGVDDEVDVGRRQLAADESELAPGSGIVAGDCEVGLHSLDESRWQSGFVGDECGVGCVEERCFQLLGREYQAPGYCALR